MTVDQKALKKEYGHLRVTHFDGKFGVARLMNDDHNLASNEPVFVFRGADRHMVEVLAFYAECCSEDSPPEHVDAAWEASNAASDWQDANPDKVKTPD